MSEVALGKGACALAGVSLGKVGVVVSRLGMAGACETPDWVGGTSMVVLGAGVGRLGVDGGSGGSVAVVGSRGGGWESRGWREAMRGSFGAVPCERNCGGRLALVCGAVRRQGVGGWLGAVVGGVGWAQM